MINVPHSIPYLTSDDEIAIGQAYQDYFVGFDQELDVDIKKNIREYFDYPFIFILPSASLALLLILKACNLNKNDEVIMSSINCWSVYNVISMENLKPILCDVISTTDFRVDIDDIRSKITSRTKIVIVTHMFGALIDNIDIKQLKKDYPNIYIIEDFSTSFLPLKNINYGSFSDFAIASFGSTKPLTGGIGGVLFSKYNLFSEKYDISNTDKIAFNMKISRMDQLLLFSQLNNYDNYQTIRSSIINFYKNYINIYSPKESTMFRAITFDDIKKLTDTLNSYNINLDIRNSVQPNFSKEMKLSKLKNSFSFDNYSSLPLNIKMYEALKNKGLI